MTAANKKVPSRKEYMAAYYRKTREKQLQESRERSATSQAKARRRLLRANNPDPDRQRQKKYRDSTPELQRSRRKSWRDANRAKVRDYLSQKYASDPQFKASILLRNRLNAAIKNNSTRGSAVSLLGCSIGELIAHLERHFEPGMAWSNWGRSGWHIDHIEPLSGFDLDDVSQLAVACHFSNLRPMWGVENLRKGGRKLAERGGELVEVPAAYTSQTCAECGVVDRESREDQATFKCCHCGHEDNADVNAARNVLQARTLAVEPPKRTQRRVGKRKQLKEAA